MQKDLSLERVINFFAYNYIFQECYLKLPVFYPKSDFLTFYDTINKKQEVQNNE